MVSIGPKCMRDYSIMASEIQDSTYNTKTIKVWNVLQFGVIITVRGFAVR